MFSRRLAVFWLAIGVAVFIPAFIARCYAVPQSDQLNSTESNRQGGKTQNPTGDATSHALPDHMHNPRDLGSAYVPLDSWIYPALERLAALGYIHTEFLGMRPWTRNECARLVEEAGEIIRREESQTTEASRIYNALEGELSPELAPSGAEQSGSLHVESFYTRALGISGPLVSKTGF